MDKIINGKEIAKATRQKLKVQIDDLFKKTNKRPHLVVVLVGDDPASASYVKAKDKACEKIGMKSTIIKRPETITQSELLDEIKKLNNDDDVTGILVQLPLPKHIDKDTVVNTISPLKDVDGFHPISVGNLYNGNDTFAPCTPAGIIKLLKTSNVTLAGSEAVVVGRSLTVGKPVANMLVDENATVTIAHSRTKNLKEVTKRADILVVAVGRAHLVTADMIKEGAVVIDVGVNRVDGKLVGDVDYDEAIKVASKITPVPGGVGPMTIATLLENTLKAFNMQNT